MNTVQRLLAFDAGKLKTPEKDVKLKLKKLNGEEFIFPCKAVDAEYVSELQEASVKFKKGDMSITKTYETKVLTIIEGCPVIFKDKELLKHFGATTPKDLVSKLLVSGEIDELKSQIDQLGGYDEDNEEEVKN